MHAKQSYWYRQRENRRYALREIDGEDLSYNAQEFASAANKDDHAHNKDNWFVGGHNRNKKKRSVPVLGISGCLRL